MLQKLLNAITTPEIEFLCHKEDYGIIPEPYPARKLMPEWYKHLPQRVNKQNTLDNSTIKRCAPFLDAMSVGWIIPLAADVEFISNEGLNSINYKWNFYRTMVENHRPEQLSSDGHPHPESPKPPMKFLNWWYIKVPRGYSVLFVPPLNRQDKRFQCISGLVDCDIYKEFINFPFFFNEPNYTGIITAGTPLVQAIPIRRDTLNREYETGPMRDSDMEDIEITRRGRSSHESLYRDKYWVRK